MRPKLLSWHCFTHYPKTTAPQHVIFSGKLSTIIIFKLCKFSVHLWTLYFLSYKKYIHPTCPLSRQLCLTQFIYGQSNARNQSQIVHTWHGILAGNLFQKYQVKCPPFLVSIFLTLVLNTLLLWKQIKKETSHRLNTSYTW